MTNNNALSKQTFDLVYNAVDGGMWAEWGDDGLGMPCLRLTGVKGQIAVSDKYLNSNSINVLKGVLARMDLSHIEGIADFQIKRILENAPACELANILSSAAESCKQND